MKILIVILELILYFLELVGISMIVVWLPVGIFQYIKPDMSNWRIGICIACLSALCIQIMHIYDKIKIK